MSSNGRGSLTVKDIHAIERTIKSLPKGNPYSFIAQFLLDLANIWNTEYDPVDNAREAILCARELGALINILTDPRYVDEREYSKRKDYILDTVEDVDSDEIRYLAEGILGKHDAVPDDPFPELNVIVGAMSLAKRLLEAQFISQADLSNTSVSSYKFPSLRPGSRSYAYEETKYFDVPMPQVSSSDEDEEEGDEEEDEESEGKEHRLSDDEIEEINEAITLIEQAIDGTRDERARKINGHIHGFLLTLRDKWDTRYDPVKLANDTAKCVDALNMLFEVIKHEDMDAYRIRKGHLLAAAGDLKNGDLADVPGFIELMFRDNDTAKKARLALRPYSDCTHAIQLAKRLLETRFMAPPMGSDASSPSIEESVPLTQAINHDAKPLAVPVSETAQLTTLDKLTTRLGAIFEEALATQIESDKYATYAYNRLAAVALSFRTLFGNVLLERYESPARMSAILTELLPLANQTKRVFDKTYHKIDVALIDEHGVNKPFRLIVDNFDRLAYTDYLIGVFGELCSSARFARDHADHLTGKLDLFSEVYASVADGAGIAARLLSTAASSNLVRPTSLSKMELQLVAGTRKEIAANRPNDKTCIEMLDKFTSDFSRVPPSKDSIARARKACILWLSIFNREDAVTRKDFSAGTDELKLFIRGLAGFGRSLGDLTKDMLNTASTGAALQSVTNMKAIVKAVLVIKDLIDLRFPPNVPYLLYPSG